MTEGHIEYSLRNKLTGEVLISMGGIEANKERLDALEEGPTKGTYELVGRTVVLSSWFTIKG